MEEVKRRIFVFNLDDCIDGRTVAATHQCGMATNPKKNLKHSPKASFGRMQTFIHLCFALGLGKFNDAPAEKPGIQRVSAWSQKRQSGHMKSFADRCGRQ